MSKALAKPLLASALSASRTTARRKKRSARAKSWRVIDAVASFELLKDKVALLSDEQVSAL